MKYNLIDNTKDDNSINKDIVRIRNISLKLKDLKYTNTDRWAFKIHDDYYFKLEGKIIKI